jgi:hypothetical protein
MEELAADGNQGLTDKLAVVSFSQTHSSFLILSPFKIGKTRFR